MFERSEWLIAAQCANHCTHLTFPINFLDSAESSGVRHSKCTYMYMAKYIYIPKLNQRARECSDSEQLHSQRTFLSFKCMYPRYSIRECVNAFVRVNDIDVAVQYIEKKCPWIGGISSVETDSFVVFAPSRRRASDFFFPLHMQLYICIWISNDRSTGYLPVLSRRTKRAFGTAVALVSTRSSRRFYRRGASQPQFVTDATMSDVICYVHSDKVDEGGHPGGTVKFIFLSMFSD